MSDKLLTFELSADGLELSIHGDTNGLVSLQEVTTRVLATGQHEHLATPSWAGDELTEEPQSDGASLIHQVTVHIWK